MTDDLAYLWDGVTTELRRHVPETTYDIWLAPLRLVGIDGRRMLLDAPADLRQWVSERFGRLLDDAARTVLGAEATVVLVEGAGPATPAAATRARPRGGDPEADGGGASEPAPPPGNELNPKFTFGQFVIGDANRFAHAAALAVAELPGQAYNPLFIYGPPGVGKTHLLHAIGNYVDDYGPGLTVRLTTAERFTNDFVGALHHGAQAIDRFKARYRQVDVLLVDDIQFLERKAKTEEEFFHTFNALHDLGSQLVLTSDRVPRDLAALEDRLRERFEAGLVTDIRPPDLATRLTVLRKRVHHDGITLADEDVLVRLAERIPTNIRSLEGALIRVVAFASLTGRTVSSDVAGEVLDGLYGRGRGPATPASAALTVEDVQDVVCRAFSLTRDELLSTSRAPQLTWARQVAMYLAREHTQESLPAIGRRFGGRNHTTVLHAVRRTTERLASDREAYETVRALTEQLHRPGADRGD